MSISNRDLNKVNDLLERARNLCEIELFIQESKEDNDFIKITGLHSILSGIGLTQRYIIEADEGIYKHGFEKNTTRMREHRYELKNAMENIRK